MGKKDEYQFDYLDDDGRFADQINGALFNAYFTTVRNMTPSKNTGQAYGRYLRQSDMRRIRRS